MKYPIGIQDFESIIMDGYVYVDKIDLIYKMVSEGKIYFLSRPRRFGKSLLVSTLKHYFLGHKELFKGLAIDSLEKKWAEYPVFHIDFNGEDFTTYGVLERKIIGAIEGWEKKYGESSVGRTLGDRLFMCFRKPVSNMAVGLLYSLMNTTNRCWMYWIRV